jgi:hypothetical protein
LGGEVALFVLAIVAVVVGLTWLDWRDTAKNWVLPDWAKGLALAGVAAVSLASLTAFASSWIQDSGSQWDGGLSSRLFWPELAFLLCSMGIIISAVRKKRLRILIVLAVVLTAAFWLGMAISG